jgi:hypothetical protein
MDRGGKVEILNWGEPQGEWWGPFQLAIDGQVCPAFDLPLNYRGKFASDQEILDFLKAESLALLRCYGDARSPETFNRMALSAVGSA